MPCALSREIFDTKIYKKTGEIKVSPEAKIRLFIPGLYDNNGDSAAHEMIHAMEAKWILQDYSKTSDRVNAWVEHTYSKSICYNALVSLGKQKDTGTIDDTVWKSNAQTIYRSTWEKNNPADAYAAVNYAETITSTVQAALRYGEKNISPYGQAILKELRKEIKRHRRRGGKQ